MAEAAQRLLSAHTRYCAVYGWPVRHSASPAMHNAALARLGLDWRYLAFEVHPTLLREAIEGARAMRFLGLNLTVPHKQLAFDLVNHLDDSARRWGAVNTIRFEALQPDGSTRPLAELDATPESEVVARGFNTDADALIRALAEDLGFADLSGSTLVLLGTGGAGQGAALRLAETRPAHLHIINRTRHKAETTADIIRSRQPDIEISLDYPSTPVDLLINATSLGLKSGDPLPCDPRALPLKRVRAVYDMIYQPAQTPLLAAARDAGCRTANGLGMLLYQGAKALEIWTGRPAPIDVMRRALEQHVYG